MSGQPPMLRFCLLVLVFCFVGISPLHADYLTPAASSVTAVAVSSSSLVEPFVWPVSRMIGPKKTAIVSKFGKRKIPALPLLATSTVVVPTDELHEGIDFAVPNESNIRAARSGRVLFAGYSTAYVSRADKKDKNHLVIIRHADGKSTRYVHLNRLMVRPGQDVKAGDVIGTSSESDEWSVPVVHFEIRETNGQAVDPLLYLVDPSTGTMMAR
jgi:murein DD-endopeptidase MepM/ murein hydrolase activator NlpD